MMSESLEKYYDTLEYEQEMRKTDYTSWQDRAADDAGVSDKDFLGEL